MTKMEMWKQSDIDAYMNGGPKHILCWNMKSEMTMTRIMPDVAPYT